MIGARIVDAGYRTISHRGYAQPRPWTLSQVRSAKRVERRELHDELDGNTELLPEAATVLYADVLDTLDTLDDEFDLFDDCTPELVDEAYKWLDELHVAQAHEAAARTRAEILAVAFAGDEWGTSFDPAEVQWGFSVTARP